MKAHRITHTICVLACLWVGFGCSGLWTTVKKATPAAIGGGVGGITAGPIGAAVGAAAGSAIGDSVVENSDLRSGELVGEDALTKEIKRQAVVIASLRGDVAGARIALENLEGKSAEEEHKTHWLMWISLAALVLVILKWGRTLKADFYKARNVGLPVLKSLIHTPDAVENKQGP